MALQVHDDVRLHASSGLEGSDAREEDSRQGRHGDHWEACLTEKARAPRGGGRAQRVRSYIVQGVGEPEMANNWQPFGLTRKSLPCFACSVTPPHEL